MRQLDVAADPGIGETPGLHMAGIGEHGLGELELGLGQRLGPRACCGKIRRLVVAEIEAVRLGVLEARNGRFRARILDAPVEPKRREIAVLIERLDCRALFLAGKNPVRFRRQQIANLFRNRAIGGIERSHGVRRRRRLLRCGGGGSAGGRSRQIASWNCGGGWRLRRRLIGRVALGERGGQIVDSCPRGS